MMQTSVKTINNRPYLLINVEQIRQKSQIFYLGKLKAKDLVELYTVSPTIYDLREETSLAKSFVSDADYYEFLSSSKSLDAEQGFQRQPVTARAKEISQFLVREEFAFFPNTIIASCSLINGVDEAELDIDSSYTDFSNLADKPDHLAFLYKEGEQFQLLVPYKKEAILIIDGQHRLEGLSMCASEIQNDYELLVAFIIGYDRSVIAQQFYTINYNQKPVNRSLLLHLTGEFSESLNEHTFLHNVVKILNENEKSPFFKKVKMLGSTHGIYGEDKRQLSISQAFLIDHLIRYIDRGLIESKTYLPIFLYYYQKKEYHIEIIRFIIKYFSAIQELKEDWNTPNTSILSKGMGVGAFIVVLHYVFPQIFIKEWNSKPEKIKDITVDYLKGILERIQNIDFTRDGDYAGAGSSGTITKIKNKILETIEFEDNGEIEDFRAWLKKHTK